MIFWTMLEMREIFSMDNCVTLNIVRRKRIFHLSFLLYIYIINITVHTFDG